MAKKDNYISARESRRISRENRKITAAIEKKRNRKNIPESEYVTQMKDPENCVEFDEVKTYVYLRVQMVFDPPASNLVAEAKKEVIKELEWRINVKVDPKEMES